MNNHIKSLFITSLLWSVLIFLLTHSFTKNNAIIPVSLEIQLESSGHVAHRHLPVENEGGKSNKEWHHDVAHNIGATQAEQSLEPIYQPLPAIPEELRDEAFSSLTMARFYIDSAGNVEKVELIQPSNNPKLNQLLLKSLKKWKFSASNRATSKDIKVNFEVK